MELLAPCLLLKKRLYCTFSRAVIIPRKDAEVTEDEFHTKEELLRIMIEMEY